MREPPAAISWGADVSIIQSNVRMLAPKVVQPDAPHRGAIESELCVQTNALAFRLSGTTRTVAYPEFSSAPTATITAWNTWTDFLFTSTGAPAFQLPWYMQQHHGKILGLVNVMYSHTHALKLRIYTYDCVSSLTNEYGPETAVLVPATGPATREIMWLTEERPARYYANIGIAPVNFSATRRLAIGLQAKIEQVNAASPFPSGNRYVYLHSAFFYDGHAREAT